MKNFSKIMLVTMLLLITSVVFIQAIYSQSIDSHPSRDDNQAATLTTDGPSGSILSTDATGVVTNFTVGTAENHTQIMWFERGTTILEFNDGIPLEVNDLNATIWDGENHAEPVVDGFFIPARFEDWSFDGDSDNEWHTILQYEDVANNIDIIGAIGYKLEDPSPELGAGYVAWTPSFQYTNVSSETVTIKPFRYLRHTANNTVVTYYCNHDSYNSFWDYDNIDGTPDDYAVEVKNVSGYLYGYAMTGFPLINYRIQAYEVDNNLFEDITDAGAGYNLPSLTDPVYGHSEFGMQFEEITLAQNQAALYWLYPKVILVNNSAVNYPTNIDWEIKSIGSSDFGDNQVFADTDVNINYGNITYTVNGNAQTATQTKVTVAEITGGMIESSVDATLDSVLSTRYWEIFYDTRRTASTASMIFTYDVATDNIEEEGYITIAFRSDYGEDWTACENVTVDEAANTVTVSEVSAGSGHWALAVRSIIPTNLVISIVGDDVELNWDDKSAATYFIYRSTNPHTEDWGEAIGNSNVNSYTDVGAASEIRYFYRVTAE